MKITVAALLSLILLPVLWGWWQKQELVNAFSQIEIPQEWTLQESVSSGNVLCLDSCNTLSKRYQASIAHDQAPQIFNNLVKSAGFEMVKADDNCDLPTNVSGTVWYCSFEAKSSSLKLLLIFYPPTGDSIKDTVAISIYQR